VHKEAGLIAYELKSVLNIVSVISTILAQQNPEEIIIIRKKTPKGEWKMSIRSQTGRANVGRLTKNCVKGIGSGGGHEKAAGALITDWEKFKERFLAGLRGA
jgi:single-stranded DNA-specific DHH superfamily exonuclease